LKNIGECRSGSVQISRQPLVSGGNQAGKAADCPQSVGRKKSEPFKKPHVPVSDRLRDPDRRKHTEPVTRMAGSYGKKAALAGMQGRG